MCLSMLWLEGYSCYSFTKSTKTETRVSVQAVQQRNPLKLERTKNKLEVGSKVVKVEWMIYSILENQMLKYMEKIKR